MSLTLAPLDDPLQQAAGRLASARALVFDVDGTLAETEELHRRAFNESFQRVGIDWHWGRTMYGQLLRTAGGKERIRAFDAMRLSGPPLSDERIATLHRLKTTRFAELMTGEGCPLRPGIRELVDAARRRGQQLAIATTTSRDNIDVLLTSQLGAGWSELFAAVVAGDEVAEKKPAPDVYLETLARLGLKGSDCIAIEDSANGLMSASRAGIAVLITRSLYFRDDDFAEAICVVDDLTELPPG